MTDTVEELFLEFLFLTDVAEKDSVDVWILKYYFCYFNMQDIVLWTKYFTGKVHHQTTLPFYELQKWLFVSSTKQLGNNL